jgi:hypothetical protein
MMRSATDEKWLLKFFSEAIKSGNNVGELWKHLKGHKLSIKMSYKMYNY